MPRSFARGWARGWLCAIGPGRSNRSPTVFGSSLPPMSRWRDVMDLVVSESECCAFYTFTVSVEGPERRLEINAGPGGGPAVQALLGLGV